MPSVPDPQKAPPAPPETRMQRFWAWLAVEAGKRAGLVALVTLLITLVAGYGVTRLEFATGQDSYLNNGDQVYIDNVEYQDLFGGQAMVVLFTLDEGTTHADFFSEHNLAELDRVSEELRGHDDLVDAVVGPQTVQRWSENLLASPDGDPTNSVAGQALLAATDTDAEHAELRLADASTTLERLAAIPEDERVLSNPAWSDLLLRDNEGEIRRTHRSIYPDEQHEQMVVRLTGNASIDTESAGADLVTQTIADADFEGATVIVTGAPLLLQEINDYLVGGMLQLGAIALVIMLIILLLFFQVRWRLLPLVVVLFGVLWAFGLAGYLDIPLSLVTIAGLPVMLGVGIDYAIQMHSRVEEEVLIDRNPHPIQESARRLGPALLIVTFDAIFAFTALRFAEVPMIREFGFLLAVGIAVICLTSILLTLSALGIREYRSPTTGRDYRENWLSRLTVTLGRLPIGIAPIFAVVSLAIFFGGIAVEDDIELQTDVVQWVNQSGDVIKDYRTLEDETGSSSEYAVYVQAEDAFSQDVVDFVHEFSERNLDQHPDELLTASSLITTISYLLEVPDAGEVVPRAEDVEAAYAVAPEDIQISTVNVEEDAHNLIFRYGRGSLEDRATLLDEIEASTQSPETVQWTSSGLAAVGVGLLENLNANRVLLTYLAVLFVGLFLALRLRSVLRSLLSLVPVVIAVGGTSLVAWAFGLRLSPMTAVGGPLVIAVCTEFTSLILLRFVEERQRGLIPHEAADVAAARTGRAFMVSAFTTMVGVGVIATSSLPLLRDFGIVVAMNVGVALLSALIVLPPLLVWAEQWGRVSKGLIPEETRQATSPKLAAADTGRLDPAHDG